MESTPNAESEEPERTDSATTPDGAATYVCRVCQESIPHSAPRRCREGLVHRACVAELRCGVSLSDPGQRHRRRDHASW